MRMRKKLKPEPFREPELEESWQRIQPLLRKLKRWEKQGKLKVD